MTRGEFILPRPFSLGLTLLCGQCFRWEGPDPQGWFQGVAGGTLWRLRQEDDRLHWQCHGDGVRGQEPGTWLWDYLGLHDDLEAFGRSFEGNSVMEVPLRTLPGLRILKQEPWECTVSYMFAQGLSVKVIQGALRKFCDRFGEPLEGAPHLHAFPEAKVLARLSPDELRPFTNNYRARAQRIIRLARAVEARVISLDHLKELPCDEGRDSLTALEGIGPKIADCILLFSLDQEDAFPVDRWVLRAMKRYFPKVRLGRSLEAPTPTQYVRIVRKARLAFGERCGLASEYLFLYLRLLEDEKLKRELSPFCQSLDRLGPAEPRRSGKGPRASKPSRRPL